MTHDEFSRESGDAGLPSPDLLRQCGLRLTDARLWEEFQRRFQRRIFLYLLRACRVSRGQQEELREVLMDLAQEVYVRLVQNDGRILQGFRGETDFAVWAFLARVASSVVSDHFRYQTAGKRQGKVISLEDAKNAIERTKPGRATLDSDSVRSLLAWIDIERALSGDDDRKNASRNLLIFKLHYIDGFTASELAAFPGFALSVSGVEAVLNRTRTRLRK